MRKRIFLIIVATLSVISSFMSQGHVASILNEKTNLLQSHSVSLFQLEKAENLLDESLKSTNQMIYSKSQLLNVTDKAISHLRKNDLELITVPITIPEYGMIQLKLYRQNIFTNDLSVSSSGSEKLSTNITKTLFYRGVVLGEENNSLVSISIFDDEISGVISIGKTNFNLGKIKGEKAHIIYKENDLDYVDDFVCSAIDPSDELPKPLETGNPDKTIKCVRLRVEVDAELRTQLGGTTAATNYAAGLFNHIITLYDNDNINLVVGEIYIWEGTSPYSGSSNSILNQMSNDYSGSDLTALLSSQNSGGVAYLSGLCNTNFGVSFSSVNGNYNSLPSYSWDVNVVAHELGHNLSSPHTHACSWNGNNTPIDGCGANAGYSEGCGGDNPAEGGTIMSYCHLTNVDINFNLGFGPQPTARMTNYINNSACLGTSCADNSPTCTDGIQNGTETGVDCGGSCGSCALVDVTLNVKAMLQGPYKSTTGLMNDNLRDLNKIPISQPYSWLGYDVPPASTNTGLLNVSGANAIVDWVLIELRSGDDPINVISRKAALIQADGDVVSANGSALIFEDIEESEVFVAIRHRNHFGIRTGNAFSTENNIIINFTSYATNIFGINAVADVGGKRVMYSGDANLDGQVNTIDKNSYWRVENAGVFSYWNSKADFNLDGAVNTVDKNLFWQINNSLINQLD